MKSHKHGLIEPISVSIPNGFNPLEYDLLKSGLVIDRIKLILHQIYLTKIMSMGRDGDTSIQGWFPLHSKILKLAGTKHYAKYVTWLIDNNIIELKKNFNGTKNYSVNGKSQQFRFVPEILKSVNGRLFHREIIRDYKTIKSGKLLKEYFAERPINNSSLELNDTHKHLISMTEGVKFNLRLFDSIRYTPDFLNSITSDESELLDEYHEKMEAINEGEIKFATVDRFGERLHTPLTNLWSVLRNFMYFKDFPNEPLVVLDFANSQPYFSSVCASIKLMEEILPEFINCIPIIQNANITDDFSAFARMCSDGSIYNFWATARSITRKEAKHELIVHVMFGKSKSTHAIIKKTRKIFGAHFPSVLKMFDEIKTANADDLPFIKTIYVDEQNNFSERKDLYKNLSCMLQRAESRMVIGKIAPALIEAGLIPFITIHDSFIVMHRHEEKVRKIIKEEFERLEAHPPNVKSTQLFVP